MFDWLLTWGQVLGAIASVVLSIVLAILYWRMSKTQHERTDIHKEQTKIQKDQISIQDSQTEIQRDQTKIMESQQELEEERNTSMIAAGIGEYNLFPRVVLENVGGRAAISVTADWKVGDEEVHWTTPILSSGDRVQIPLAGELYHQIEDIREKIEPGDDIVIKLSHRSPRHEERNQKWTFDLETELSRLEEYVSEQDEEPRYDVGRELNKIRKETKKIRRNLKN